MMRMMATEVRKPSLSLLVLATARSLILITAHGSTVSGNVFMYQPRNITAMEGETVKFNCSSANNALTAFWIIDGIEHDLRDLRRTSTYTFDLLDNSLTINNATKGLDGTAYQCVIDQQASEIGFLTVISKEQFTRSPSRYLRATYIECFNNTTNSIVSMKDMYTASSMQLEEPRRFNDTCRNSCIAAVAVTTGVLCVIFLSLNVLILCFLIKKHRQKSDNNDKPQQAPALEMFMMVPNDLYGNGLNVDQFGPTVMTENKSYNHRSSYLTG